jgi:hypothetical protein
LPLPPDLDGPPTPRQYHIVGPRIKVEQVAQKKGNARNRNRGKHGQAEKEAIEETGISGKEASGKEAGRETGHGGNSSVSQRGDARHPACD